MSHVMGNPEGDRYYRKGRMEDEITFSGQWCVVRWSYRSEEIFGGVSPFARDLFTSVRSLGACYGGRVREPVGGDGVVEEYLAVLRFQHRASKRVGFDLGYFAVTPLGDNRMTSRARELEEIELVLAKGYSGSEHYKDFRRRWCDKIRAECFEFFGDRMYMTGEREEDIAPSTQVTGDLETIGTSQRDREGSVDGSEAMTVVDRTGLVMGGMERKRKVARLRREVRMCRQRLRIEQLLEELSELGEEEEG